MKGWDALRADWSKKSDKPREQQSIIAIGVPQCVAVEQKSRRGVATGVKEWCGCRWAGKGCCNSTLEARSPKSAANIDLTDQQVM